MPNEQGAGAPQGNESSGGQQPIAGAPGQQPNPPQTPSPAAPVTPAAAPEPKPDSANKLIKDFAGERGVSVEKLLDLIRADEDSKKTETEKLTGERDDYKSKADAAETRLRDAVGRSAVLEAAQKSNASEPGAIFALIATDLDYDDDGAPTNVDEALDKAKTTYPKLFRAAGGTGDGGKGGATEPDVTPGLARMRRAYEKSEKTAKR